MAFQYEEAMELPESWNPISLLAIQDGAVEHTKKVWPECRHIAYVEWWFDPHSSLYYDKNEDLRITEKSVSRQCIGPKSAEPIK